MNSRAVAAESVLLLLIIAAAGFFMFAEKSSMTGLAISAFSSCLDTDGGLNYYLKGAAVITTNESKTISYTDACLNSTTLTEYYCRSRFPASINQSCTYGCQAGACIKPKCTDSDGGRDYYTRGVVFGPRYERALIDYCYLNSRYAVEYYCAANGYESFALYACLEGCRDGACNTPRRPDLIVYSLTTDRIAYSAGDSVRIYINETNQGEKNAEHHETNIYVDGAQNAAHLVGSFNFTAPIAPGSIQEPGSVYYFNASWFALYTEYFGRWRCPTNTSMHTITVVVDALGEVNESNETNNIMNITINCGAPNTCTDSDRGIKYYTRGIVIGPKYGINLTDYCFLNNTHIIEYYCDFSSNEAFIAYACPDSCENGACSSCPHGCPSGEVCHNGLCIMP